MKLVINYNECILYATADEGTTEDDVTVIYTGEYIFNKMLEASKECLRVAAAVKTDDGSFVLDLAPGPGGTYMQDFNGSLVIGIA